MLYVCPVQSFADARNVGRWTRYSTKNIITVGLLLALRLGPLPMFASGFRIGHLAGRRLGLHLQVIGIHVGVVFTSCRVVVRVVSRNTFQTLLSMEVKFHMPQCGLRSNLPSDLRELLLCSKYL